MATDHATTHGRDRLPRWARAADVLASALVLLGLWASLHPIRGEVLGIPIQVQRWWRLLIAASVVAAARHAAVPVPSLLARVVEACLRARSLWRAIGAVAPVVVCTRLLVLLVGYFAVVTVGLRSEAPPGMGQRAGPELPLRWDAGWYLGIASEGYDWTGSVRDQQTLNFFPAFPMATRFVSWAIRARSVPASAVQPWVGTVLSMVAFLIACVYLYQMVAREHGADAAGGAVLLLATYPFALFYSAAYPEALFLASAVGAWYHLQRGQAAPAAIWGLVAGLSRPNGGLLTAPLAVLLLRERRRALPLYVAALAPISGTLLYSAWAYRLTGHPFVWAELQRSAFLRTYRGIGDSLGGPLGAILRDGFIAYVRRSPWELMNLGPALLGIAAIVPVTIRLGLAAGVFLAITVFVPLLNGGLVSMGRYTAVLFPMFVWLALLVPPQGRALVAACFALCQGVLASLFFTWWPVF